MMNKELKSMLYAKAQTGRREYVSELLDILDGDWAEILEDEVDKLFLPQNADKLRPRIDTSINVLKQAASQIACIYSRTVTRTLDESEDPFEVFDSLDLAFDAADKKMFVCKEVFIRPLYDADRNKMTVDLLTPNHAWALPDPLDPLGLSMLVYQRGDEYVLWTADRYEVYDHQFDRIIDRENPNGENPFGVIPWVCLHDSFPSDGQVFHEGESEQLRQATVAAGIQKTDLNHIQHLQSFKQLVGTGIDKNEKFEQIVDPSVMMSFERGDASVSVLDMQADVKNLLDTLLESSAITLNQMGIRPEMTRGTLSAQSGYALKIQTHNRERQWEMRRTLWRSYEQRFYDVARQVWQFFTGLQLPEGTVQVQYQPLGVGANLSEEVTTYSTAVNSSLISRRSAMMKLWNMTEDEAEAEIEQMQKEEVQLMPPLVPTLDGGSE